MRAPLPARLGLGGAGLALLRWLALLGSLGLNACNTTRPQAAELPFIDIAPRWHGTPVEQRTDLARWWERFDDPALAVLVQDALSANADIAGALAALRQSRALRDVAQADLYPRLGGALSASHNRRDSNNADSVSAALDASWELDVFGGRRSAVRAGDAVANASAASLGDVQVSVAAEVVLNYISLRSAQERLEIASTNLAIQQGTLEIADWRLQAGLVSLLETEQARAALEQTRALLPVLRVAIAQAAHALAVLTGRTPEVLLEVLRPVAIVPQPASDIALSVPADTLRQRADVRLAEYQVVAATARMAQAEAARWPVFRLTGSIGLDALTLAGLGSGASVFGTLLAGATLPILDGGATSAQVLAQRAALEQAQASYKASVLNALKDVEDALVALRGDRQRLESLRLAAGAAVNATQMANDRFQSGLVDFQTVLDTQRTRLATQDSVASAFAAVSTDHVRLYKALGGGWQSEARAVEQ